MKTLSGVRLLEIFYYYACFFFFPLLLGFLVWSTAPPNVSWLSFLSQLIILDIYYSVSFPVSLRDKDQESVSDISVDA